MTGLQLYDPADASAPTSPGIAAGVIQLPAGVDSVENVSGSVSPLPTPGLAGWVQTMYLPFVYNGSTTQLYSVRQLMRMQGSTLQVVQQDCYDGSTWSDSSA